MSQRSPMSDLVQCGQYFVWHFEKRGSATVLSIDRPGRKDTVQGSIMRSSIPT